MSKAKVERRQSRSGTNVSDKKTPQTIDHVTGKPDPTPLGKRPRRIDLSTLRDVRLELAAVYRMIDAGEIPSQEGTRRAYVLRAIGEIIELAELERRIEELESRNGADSQRF